MTEPHTLTTQQISPSSLQTVPPNNRLPDVDHKDPGTYIIDSEHGASRIAPPKLVFGCRRRPFRGKIPVEVRIGSQSNRP